jgi:hypothetical protein
MAWRPSTQDHFLKQPQTHVNTMLNPGCRTITQKRKVLLPQYVESIDRVPEQTKHGKQRQASRATFFYLGMLAQPPLKRWS